MSKLKISEPGKDTKPGCRRLRCAGCPEIPSLSLTGDFADFGLAAEQFTKRTCHMLDDRQPSASVIVPLYNSRRHCERLAEGLLTLTAPTGDFEVVLVDNGSSDGTLAALESALKDAPFPVHFCEELGNQSSYAARNKGLCYANGSVLAFTDADCKPSPEWLTEGLAALESTGADLAGGQVQFSFARSMPSAAEYIDATRNMQMSQSISREGVAKTANLFVRRSVFDKVGPFDSRLRSGGDVEWTRRATQAGATLVYAEKAVVFHPARNLAELVKKQIRVGTGQMAMLRAQKKSFIDKIACILSGPRRNRSSADPEDPRSFSNYHKPPWLAFRLTRFTVKFALRVGRFLEFIYIRVPASW